MPQNIKFIHCRVVRDGKIQPKGGLTIAYVLNDTFKVVGYAAAKCHERDHYNKRVARAKSAGRLLSADYYTECPEIDEPIFINQTHDGFRKAFA